MTEHLVTATGDRILGERQHAGQHITNRLVPRSLLSAGTVERTRAVVQQSGVGQSECSRHRRVCLVTTRADRVVAVALGAQPTSGVIQYTALDLGGEDARQWSFDPGTRRGRRVECSDPAEQGPFEFVEVVGQQGAGHARIVGFAVDLDVEPMPVTFRHDIDGAVDHADRGLVVDRVRGTVETGSPRLGVGQRVVG